MGSDKVASKIYHKFTVSNENKEFDIKCNSNPSCAKEFSLVDSSNMSPLIDVKFKIIYQNLQFFTLPENVNSSSINNSLEEPKPKKAKTQFIYKSLFDSTSKVVEFPSEHHLQCSNCKEHCIFSISVLHAVEYYYSPTHNDFLCFCCFQWLYAKNEIKENHVYLKQSTIPTVQLRFCKWNCGQHFNFSKILLHEVFCKKNMYYYNCPKQNCTFRNSASALKIHMRTDHNCAVPVCASLFQLAEKMECFVLIEDQIIHFKLTQQDNGYKSECKMVTNDKNIQSEWKPMVLFFYDFTRTILAKLPLSTEPTMCRAKIVLVKNE
ncbi:uncharacterized protein LOC126889713 [Diabrotica virgifera virgifera]|uniref:C2H2-type domain-containing protein n=1 Tax=Diabrotica virgifera virgifera TaxID=50390 RepID=A0ABM5KVJ1_DIAVI|nr:uncharacterized protein LOC126889713 [Diabrotica virgifera virgifera]